MCLLSFGMTDEKRPPNDRGQGRKAKSPSGKPMTPRPMRWDDSDWADAKFITLDRVRELTRKEAARLRKKIAKG